MIVTGTFLKLMIDKYSQGFELYDIQHDPGEKTNLADEFPEIAKEMKAELRKWQESVLNSLTGVDYK